jgi:tRNA threonylcarbamoyladenosine biosynthesis protein TsaB
VILALKTAGPTTELWLLSTTKDASVADSKPVASLTWESGRDLADQLLAHLTAFMSDHQVNLTDLTGILIFSGPGSFTSLRIGHSVANALADSLAIPVVGASGERWQLNALSRLPHQAAGHPVLPDYGAEAHITKPGASQSSKA